MLAMGIDIEIICKATGLDTRDFKDELRKIPILPLNSSLFLLCHYTEDLNPLPKPFDLFQNLISVQITTLSVNAAVPELLQQFPHKLKSSTCLRLVISPPFNGDVLSTHLFSL